MKKYTLISIILFVLLGLVISSYSKIELEVITDYRVKNKINLEKNSEHIKITIQSKGTIDCSKAYILFKNYKPIESKCIYNETENIAIFLIKPIKNSFNLLALETIDEKTTLLDIPVKIRVKEKIDNTRYVYNDDIENKKDNRSLGEKVRDGIDDFLWSLYAAR